jgi:hypothetical protein
MRILGLTIAALLAATSGDQALGDPFVDGVWKFSPGTFAGFGQERLPWIVLGPPQGTGVLEGATDVVSLGEGGQITLAFRDNVVVDGFGPDLVIFENAFHAGDENGPVFTELAFVAVSVDRKTWLSFPYDPATGVGLAGREPVLSNTANGVDPFSPEAGGDRFDLADLGLDYISYVRIVDVNGAIADAGDLVAPGGKGGFDLDAVGAIHSVAAARVSGTVTSAGEPVAYARIKLVPSNGGRKLRRRTGPEGAFEFSMVVPSGAYVLKAVRLGIGSAIAEPMIDQGGSSLEFDLQLTSP